MLAAPEPGGSRLGESVWHDAVDAAAIVAAVEILEPLDRLGNAVGEIEDLAVEIGDVERAVRAVGERDRPEPEIGGGQEFLGGFVRQPPRPEADTVRRQPPMVHEVVAGNADEHIAAVLRAETRRRDRA